MENTKLQYDANKVQAIELDLPKGNKIYTVFHKLKPLSDERYFAFAAELEENAKRNKTLSSSLYAPKHNLWLDLVQSVEKYGYGDNWKERVKQLEGVRAINTLLKVEPVFKAEKAGDDELFTDDDLTPVTLACIFDGNVLELTHNFREETKDEFDEYLAILGNEPQKNVLASAKKKTPAQRFYELYASLSPQSEDYVGGVVPAWHKIAAVQTFMEGQFARLGKF